MGQKSEAFLGKGAILFHSEFEFTNGEKGEKLLIVLNNPDPKKEPFLICRVTSKQKSKPKIFGCNQALSLFFLPAGHDFFQQDTWIQLHEIFSFDAPTVLDDHFKGKLELLGNLQELTIRQLMNCIKSIRDISENHKKFILRD